MRKVSIIGVGAIGSIAARALLDGIRGYELVGLCDPAPAPHFPPELYCSMQDAVSRADLIIEALPPAEVPALCNMVLDAGKDLLLVTSSALLTDPRILDHHKSSACRIIVPSCALCGIDGVSALQQIGITKARIATTKKPAGYAGAPYIVQNDIKLEQIETRRKLFEGNAQEAAKGFPANVNVAATLSLAGAGPENTLVEIWADPHIEGNTHEIEVSSAYSTITARVQNTPDPGNPKTSLLAAYSVVSVLKGFTEPLVVL